MSFLPLAVQNGGKTWCFRLSLVLPCPFGCSSLYGRDAQMGASSLPGFWANYILSFFPLLETTVWVTQEGTAGEGGEMIQTVFKNQPPCQRWQNSFSSLQFPSCSHPRPLSTRLLSIYFNPTLSLQNAQKLLRCFRVETALPHTLPLVLTGVNGECLTCELGKTATPVCNFPSRSQTRCPLYGN